MPLILIVGLPGTGKTTFARELQTFLPADVIYLSTDSIRRNIFQPTTVRADPVEYNEGIYSTASKDLIYQILYFIGELLLGLNHVLIIDGTFYTQEKRKRFFSICERLNQDIILIETRCSEEIVRARLEKRIRQGESASDADFRIYLKIKEQFEPLEHDHITVNTELDPIPVLEEVKKRLESL
ncbi:MAG: AAA family ATPase [Candidatus Heimdallarchaeota archaeon]